MPEMPAQWPAITPVMPLPSAAPPVKPALAAYGLGVCGWGGNEYRGQEGGPLVRFVSSAAMRSASRKTPQRPGKVISLDCRWTMAHITAPSHFPGLSYCPASSFSSCGTGPPPGLFFGFNPLRRPRIHLPPPPPGSLFFSSWLLLGVTVTAFSLPVAKLLVFNF